MNHIRNTREWTEGKSFKLRFQYWGALHTAYKLPMTVTSPKLS